MFSLAYANKAIWRQPVAKVFKEFKAVCLG